ncbi:MAG: hypothetical protein Q9226_001496 [Calogaya cf. arnoldii]
MKLIVTGATGLVGSEVICLALRNPAVTSVVAIARNPVLAPADAESESQTPKLPSVVLESWTSPYPETVIRHTNPYLGISRALAVTPSQVKDMDCSDVTTICYDYTMSGFTLLTAYASKPFRSIYTSGVTVERDQEKTLPFLSEYRLMRVCELFLFLASSNV